MSKSEPLPLYLVRHVGELAVNSNETITSRRVSDRELGPVVETLVEMTHHQAAILGRMVNVRGVVPAPAGDFQGDDGTVIHVAADGAWHNPMHR
jgi:hypothetical protein